MADDRGAPADGRTPGHVLGPGTRRDLDLGSLHNG